MWEHVPWLFGGAALLVAVSAVVMLVYFVRNPPGQ